MDEERTVIFKLEPAKSNDGGCNVCSKKENIFTLTYGWKKINQGHTFSINFCDKHLLQLKNFIDLYCTIKA